MPFISVKGQPWRPCVANNRNIPKVMQESLLDKNSLTNRMRERWHDQFSVCLLRQYWGTPSVEEVRKLGLDTSESVNIREVVLVAQKKPRVVARTLLPATTLMGANSALLHLGNSSLGDLLFKQKSTIRGPIETDALVARQFNPWLDPHGHYTDEIAWARQSYFLFHHKPLIVAEVFLPDFFS